LETRGVHFRTVEDGLSTQGSAGKLVLQMLGAVAQFERDLILERTRGPRGSQGARQVAWATLQVEAGHGGAGTQPDGQGRAQRRGGRARARDQPAHAVPQVVRRVPARFILVAQAWCKPWKCTSLSPHPSR